MTGSESNEKPTAAVETQISAEKPALSPYRAPKLRHLGSVRELTLGHTSGMSEGGGTFLGM